jgi:hypothetical protein
MQGDIIFEKQSKKIKEWKSGAPGHRREIQLWEVISGRHGRLLRACRGESCNSPLEQELW